MNLLLDAYRIVSISSLYTYIAKRSIYLTKNGNTDINQVKTLSQTRLNPTYQMMVLGIVIWLSRPGTYIVNQIDRKTLVRRRRPWLQKPFHRVPSALQSVAGVSGHTTWHLSISRAPARCPALVMSLQQVLLYILRHACLTPIRWFCIATKTTEDVVPEGVEFQG